MADSTPDKSKVVAITGAGAGMGRTLALRYAKDGARLALTDIDEKNVKETGKLAKKAGAKKVLVQKIDVADREAVYEWAADVKDKLGDADIVFNNAGIAYLAEFAEQSQEYFERVMNVNFWGVVWGSQAFLPQLRETKGSLVNTSSVFGLVGARNNTAYCAAKFAVRGMSEVLWQELKDSGIHVASVHPGGIKTSVLKNARIDTQTNQDLEKMFDEWAPTTAERAADIIYAGVAKRKKRIMVGRDARVLSFLLRLFPVSYSGVIPLLRERS